jgi:hypothetical protein
MIQRSTDTLAGVLGGKIPQELAGSAPIDALLHSVDAYLLQGEHAFLSRRKFAPFTGSNVVPVADWRSAFDMMYASLLATQTTVLQDPRWLADRGADPQATMTVAAVLAHGSNRPRTRRASFHSGRSQRVSPLPPCRRMRRRQRVDRRKKLTTGEVAVGAAVAAVLAELLFF